MVSNAATPGGTVERRTSGEEQRDVSKPQIQLSNLKKVRIKDYAIRFAFGGAVSVIAALIGRWTNVPFGGVFTAFPAILLASLTLIGEKEEQEQSAEDAEGGVLGAVAFVVAAVFIARTVGHISGAASLLLALGIWATLAVGLYLLAVRLGFLRTYQHTNKRQEDDTSQ